MSERDRIADIVGIELGAQFAEIFGADSYSAFVEGANLVSTPTESFLLSLTAYY